MVRRISSVRLVCIVLISLSLSGAQGSGQIPKKSLQTYIEEITGRESVVDCGEYHVSTSRSKEALRKSLACADDSVKQRKPSLIVVHVQGEDSALAHGLLSDAAGRAFYFDYDSAPCGGPMCAESFEKKTCWVSNVEVVPDGASYRLALAWLIR